MTYAPHQGMPDVLAFKNMLFFMGAVISAQLQPTSNLFQTATATGHDWRQVSKAVLDQLGDVQGANLGFMYLTDTLADDATSIVTLLKGLTGIECWTGAAGIGVIGDGRDHFAEPTLTIMVGQFPEDSFCLFHHDGEKFIDVGQDVSAWLERHTPSLAVVHADPRNADLPTFLYHLSDDTGTFMVGGLSSSRADYVQIANRVTENGAAGVFFDASIAVVSGLTQGCTPISAPRRITACDNNVIHQIDHRPAIEIFKADIGDALRQEKTQTEAYVFAALPVEGSDTGDFLVRNILEVDYEQGWIAIAEEVEEGQTLQFVHREPRAALQDLDHMIEKAIQRARKARGGLYFPCLSRGAHLFEQLDNDHRPAGLDINEGGEVAYIQQKLGNIPLAGFFANGEISHDRLYTHSGVLILFL